MKRIPTWLLAGALSTAALLAQSTSPSPAPASPAPSGSGGNDEVIELSPFEVSADSDIGYVGQNTLAGSRLRTNLKDVAAAISPMTAEFLSDIAATNVSDAVEYGINARMETDDGRAAGPVGELFNNNVAEIRIRGLPGGSRTLNYFRALDTVDTYKVERMDLSRGPNSILYGFGSPAGVFNASTKQARLNKQAYSASFRVDSWDGYRVVLDANVPVIDDRLAFRTAILKSEESSWRSAGHNDQERIYLAGTWKIDGKTSLKANFERGNQKRFVPRPFFGIDLISLWDDAGQPTFDNFRGNNAPGNPTRATGGNAVAGIQEISSGNRIVVSDAFPYAQDYRRFTWSARSNPPATEFDLGRANPEAVFEANWVGLSVESENFSAALQRELLPGLNAEVAFSHQTRDSLAHNMSSWQHYGLMADPNLYYPNGDPKPAENRYYFELTQNRIPTEQRLHQARGLLSYEHEFKKLGRLRTAAMAERSKHENRFQIMQQYFLNGPELTSGGAFNPNPENGVNQAYHRYYVTDRNIVFDSDFRIPGPYDLSGPVQYQDPATGATRTIYAHWMNRNAGNIDFWDEELTTTMGVAQLYLLKDRLVLTAGYRHDKLKHFETEPVRDPAAATSGRTGIWLPVLPSGDPTAELGGDTRTLGGVFHVTRWLSAFYNTSNSLNVPAPFRVFGNDPAVADFDTGGPLRDGETYDFGLKLDLLGNRLFATITRFETQAYNDVYFSGFGSVKGGVGNIWTALRDSGALSPADTAFAETARQANAAAQGFILDTKAEGYEFELVGEVRPGWSVSLNYSRTESTRENMASEVRRYIDHWRDHWLQYADFAINQNVNNGVVERNTANDYNTPEVIAATGDFTRGTTDTIQERIVDMEKEFFDRYHVYEGTRYIGDNKHNLNLRTRYSFRNGMLKGLTVGGGMRLRWDRIAGSLVGYDFTEGSSYTDPYNGRVVNSVELIKAKDQAIFDLQIGYRRAVSVFDRKLDWSIQLNVNNVTDVDDLIVNQTHPASGDPLTYRYQDPRRFILTTTFSF